MEHRDAAMLLLRDLDRRLTEAANLCRAERAITDMAILPFVRQFAAVDRAWFDAQPIARVRAWLDRNVASSLFERCMTRLAPWVPGDAPIVW